MIKTKRTFSRIKSTSTKSKFDSRARFTYINRDDPFYKPHYASTYSARQAAILSGEIPLERVRLNELTKIAKKAEQIGDSSSFEKARDLSQIKKDPDGYRPEMTDQEAMDILQSLTPWQINWETWESR